VELVEDSDLVFIGGGDVEIGMKALAFSGMIPQLNRLFRDGRAFCGVSAGSIMLGRSWARWTDPANDATAKPFPCLNFARFVCDTHDEDSDWEELRTATKLATDGALGYGIPSGAALVVDPKNNVAAWNHKAARIAKVNGEILDCQPIELEED